MEEESWKPESAKQLKELLQLQQEPFSLSQRTFVFNNIIDSEESFKCERHRIIRNSFSSNALRIVRSLFFKFIPIANDKDVDEEAKVLPSHQCHTSNLANKFHTFTLPKFRRIEIGKQQHHHTESKWKEPLPKAVCDFKNHEAPLRDIFTMSHKSATARDPLFSTSLRKLLLILNSNVLKLRPSKNPKLQEISKRTLRKRKQLLFGCVERPRKLQEIEGKSEKQHGEAKKVKITQLLPKESCVISEEWINFQKLNGDIHMEIGDAIMDDIVKEMLDIFLN